MPKRPPGLGAASPPENHHFVPQPEEALAGVPAEPAWQLTFRALRHRNYRIFMSGQAVSLIGTWMQNLAQSWLVYRLT